MKSTCHGNPLRPAAWPPPREVIQVKKAASSPVVSVAAPVVTAPGEHLADYVIEYADGTEHRVAVRRRFEVNQVLSRMQSGFDCVAV